MDRDEVNAKVMRTSEEAMEDIFRINGRWYRVVGQRFIPTLPPFPPTPRDSGRIVQNPWTGTPGAVV